MVFFITGGSRGIGAGVVRDVLAAGHDVAFSYATRQDLADEIVAWAGQHAPERRCRGYAMNLRDSAAVERVVDTVIEEFGTVDAAVLNAAVNNMGMTMTMSDEEWREVIDVNVTGAFFVCRQLLPLYLSNGSGRFIHISSLAMYGMAGVSAYSASKAALCGFSAALSKEYGRKGITSNVLTLGFFDTDMTRELMPESQKRFWYETCPAGRMGVPADVSHAVLYLASKNASFVNGETLHLTGGLRWAP